MNKISWQVKIQDNDVEMEIIDLRRNYKFESELWRAIVGLAKNSTGIKKRLIEAYEYHIIYLRPEEIPQKICRDKLTQVHNKLTKNRTMQVTDAIHRLPFKTCRAIIEDLCDIYDAYITYEWDRHYREVEKMKNRKLFKQLIHDDVNVGELVLIREKGTLEELKREAEKLAIKEAEQLLSEEENKNYLGDFPIWVSGLDNYELFVGGQNVDGKIKGDRFKFIIRSW